MILGWRKSFFRFFQWEKPNKYFGLLNNWLMCNILEGPLLAQNLEKKKNCLQCRKPVFNLCVRKIPWRRKWQPTPIFLPQEFHGQRSLVCYSPCVTKESDVTERLLLTQPVRMANLEKEQNADSTKYWNAEN